MRNSNQFFKKSQNLLIYLISTTVSTALRYLLLMLDIPAFPAAVPAMPLPRLCLSRIPALSAPVGSAMPKRPHTCWAAAPSISYANSQNILRAHCWFPWLQCCHFCQVRQQRCCSHPSTAHKPETHSCPLPPNMLRNMAASSLPRPLPPEAFPYFPLSQPLKAPRKMTAYSLYIGRDLPNRCLSHGIGKGLCNHCLSHDTSKGLCNCCLSHNIGHNPPNCCPIPVDP